MIVHLIRYLIPPGSTGKRVRNTGIPLAVALKQLLGIPLEEAAQHCRAAGYQPYVLVPRRITL